MFWYLHPLKTCKLVPISLKHVRLGANQVPHSLYPNHRVESESTTYLYHGTTQNLCTSPGTYSNHRPGRTGLAHVRHRRPAVRSGLAHLRRWRLLPRQLNRHWRLLPRQLSSSSSAKGPSAAEWGRPAQRLVLPPPGREGAGVRWRISCGRHSCRWSNSGSSCSSSSSTKGPSAAGWGTRVCPLHPCARLSCQCPRHPCA